MDEVSVSREDARHGGAHAASASGVREAIA